MSVLLTSEYLLVLPWPLRGTILNLPRYSQPLGIAELRQILAAHHKKDYAPSSGPRTVGTAIKAIVEAKISVDWNFVATDVPTEKSPDEVNNLMRKYMLAKKIVKPLGMVTPLPSPLSTPPSSPKKPADDFMDIDDEEWTGIWPLEIGAGSMFYDALDKQFFDKDWTIVVLVKDCTKDVQNKTSQFAAGVKIPLDQYGPDGFNNCLFAHSKDVLSQLQELGYCPTAPYDAFWCLPGSPWIIGPFARRHKDEEEIQIDSSQQMLREIPVTGSEDALRLMVVFKHPQDNDRGVPGLEDAREDPATHVNVNQITPFVGAVVISQDVKMEAEEDVKPGASKVKDATVQKNREKEAFLIEHLVPQRPVLRELRETQRTAKKVVPVPQLVSWIYEIHDLKTRYQRLTISAAPRHLYNTRISEQNWSKVIGRSTGYLKDCMDAYTYLETCKTEWDIVQYLADAEQVAGVESLVGTVSNKAWNKVYTRVPTAPA
ncbi:hypothetical protein B0H19DRAFT_490860 [Mycena capillaripes]|nr:hypothetical protein B0H19DRAFT_490860 [Mycena capillaripes]